MKSNMRKLVKDGYNKGNYEKFYNRKSSKITSFDKFICDDLLLRLKSNAKILDLGCGAGLPYDKYFVKNKLNLTGVDLSERHIELAKKNVKNAHFIVGDFFTKGVKGKFDAIISFFAIFHIPRKEHEKLFTRIHSLLKPGGYILLSLGADSSKYVFNPDFVGAPMAWSSYSAEKNKKLIQKVGFEIVMAVEDFRSERHLWILAKKK